MGGYFMPTSVAPSMGWTSLISQGLGILAPVIQGALTKGTGQAVIAKGAEIASKVLGPAIAGGAIGAGQELTSALIDKLKGGATSLLGIGGARKRRRMNVLNPRALRRSMRRVQGFSKFARKSFVLEKRVKMKRKRR